MIGLLDRIQLNMFDMPSVVGKNTHVALPREVVAEFVRAVADFELIVAGAGQSAITGRQVAAQATQLAERRRSRGADQGAEQQVEAVEETPLISDPPTRGQKFLAGLRKTVDLLNRAGSGLQLASAVHSDVTRIVATGTNLFDTNNELRLVSQGRKILQAATEAKFVPERGYAGPQNALVDADDFRLLLDIIDRANGDNIVDAKIPGLLSKALGPSLAGLASAMDADSAGGKGVMLAYRGAVIAPWFENARPLIKVTKAIAETARLKWPNKNLSLEFVESQSAGAGRTAVIDTTGSVAETSAEPAPAAPQVKAARVRGGAQFSR